MSYATSLKLSGLTSGVVLGDGNRHVDVKLMS
jgi:hypothetical protein